MGSKVQKPNLSKFGLVAAIVKNHLKTRQISPDFKCLGLKLYSQHSQGFQIVVKRWGCKWSESDPDLFKTDLKKLLISNGLILDPLCIQIILVFRHLIQWWLNLPFEYSSWIRQLRQLGHVPRGTWQPSSCSSWGNRWRPSCPRSLSPPNDGWERYQCRTHIPLQFLRQVLRQKRWIQQEQPHLPCGFRTKG